MADLTATCCPNPHNETKRLKTQRKRTRNMNTETHVKPKYPVGMRFTPIGRNGREYEIVDFHVTYNLAGEAIKERYVCKYLLCGQPVTDWDVPVTTIARAISKQPNKEKQR